MILTIATSTGPIVKSTKVIRLHFRHRLRLHHRKKLFNIGTLQSVISV